MKQNDDTLNKSEYDNFAENLSRKKDNKGQNGEDKNNGSNNVTRAAAVAVGLVAGGGSVYAINSMDADAPAPIPEEEVIKVTTEDDALSFEEAYNDARSHIGPGGVFRWRGGLYNTFTENEWNSMSVEEKAEFSEKINPLASGTERMQSTYTRNASHHGEHHHNGEHHHASGQHHHTEPQSNQASQPASNNNETGNAIKDEGHKENKTPTGVAASNDNDEYTITKEETGVIQGKDVIIASGTHNGNDATFVDVDKDGDYDIMVEDTNKDGEITDNEVYNIENEGVKVQNQALITDNTEDKPEVTPARNDDDYDIEIQNEYVKETDEGSKVIFANATVGGRTALFLDKDRDGDYDTALIDTDGDNDLRDEKVIDISDCNVKVQDESLINGNTMASNYSEMQDTTVDELETADFDDTSDITML